MDENSIDHENKICLYAGKKELELVSVLLLQAKMQRTRYRSAFKLLL